MAARAGISGVAVATLLSCAPGSAGLPAGPGVPPIVGIVRFPSSQADPADRRTSASPAEVATAATISLIDPRTNVTQATTLTTATGSFSLNLPSFFPEQQTYYLEAVKGLQSNLAGFDAARLRTLVKWTGVGWLSTYDSDASISTATTALSAIVYLRSLFPGPVVPDKLISSLSGGPPEVFRSAGTGVTGSEFDRGKSLVTTSLAGDRDPLSNLAYNGTAYDLKTVIAPVLRPFISGISPEPPSAGSPMTIFGGNFESVLAINGVKIGNVSVAPSTGSTQVLVVPLPKSASTGLLTVTTTKGIATLSITVVKTVDGTFDETGTATPSATRPGTTIDGAFRPQSMQIESKR
ncbi:MAG: IPT/TIG domain-containing protein [Candidatus Sericytochromatia bacterium]|uniref:IPT/TIG domain-containing protein n=1 Tax=Candidatus Tanganyikabacteria bacterium TaxID=2961651 RepID=A0A938BKL1_9BACT|nr:IPT/TIG domain-containing protein [Candidatus Tanganyikabacteria bacterium]